MTNNWHEIFDYKEDSMEKLVRIYMMENKAIDFPLIVSMDEFRSFLKNKLKEIDEKTYSSFVDIDVRKKNYEPVRVVKRSVYLELLVNNLAETLLKLRNEIL